MPRILAKVEGKGNGIKTVIVNMVDIAKALCRPPAYPCKYFGCELGAQTQIDAKKDRYIVNGSHDGQKLQELLDGFIKKFVLCPECDNPETVLVPNQKKKIIGQQCMACGYQNATVDMTHKVCTYILNHPPELGEQAAKNYAKKKPQNEGDGDDDGSPTELLEEDLEVIAVNGANAAGDDKEFDDWSADTSAAAVAQRQQDLTDGVKSLAITVELEKTPHERQELFYNFVMGLKSEGKLSEQTTANDVYAKAVQLDLVDAAPLILVGVVFTDAVVKEMPIYQHLFTKFLYVRDVKDPNAAKPYERGMKQLLGGLEKLIEAHKSVLLNKVQNILYVAYDIDYVSEEVVIEWSKKASKKFVSRELSKEIRVKAAPFVDWLQNAEEEEGDEQQEEEEDEDDGTVEFTNHPTVAKPAATSNGISNGATNDDDDDLDIDDI